MAISGTDTADQNMSVKVGNPVIYNTPVPASYATGSQTYLASDIIGGTIIHNTGGGGVNGTLPSAALLLAALSAGGLQILVGDTIECLIINGGTTASITLLAGSGVSFDANQSAASRIIATGSSKLVLLRFTNVQLGSEAYTVYS